MGDAQKWATNSYMHVFRMGEEARVLVRKPTPTCTAQRRKQNVGFK